jgi:hypothetical protein
VCTDFFLSGREMADFGLNFDLVGVAVYTNVEVWAPWVGSMRVRKA